MKKIELEIEFRLLHLKGSFESVLSKQIKVLRMSNEEDHQNRPNPKKRENKESNHNKLVLLALFCFCGIIIGGPVNFLDLRPSS